MSEQKSARPTPSDGLPECTSSARRSTWLGASWGLALALGGVACADQQVVIGVFAPERPRFTAPQKVATLNDDTARDEDPTLTGDLLEIHFMSERGTSQDIWISRRADQDSPWETPTLDLAENLDTEDNDDTPAISNDGLRMWFFRGSAERAGIWMSERASRDASERSGGTDIYKARRIAP
ncbi:hypothetical protein WMF20_23120 [Sorangium sp. So ce834]|uniref:hypothetical protein n=1 Tax=Sorangium sp. So ce834 TaxID=3133321 RepID=UPI003F604235